MRRLKQSINQYRIIKGEYFEMRTANQALFLEEKEESRKLGFKFRIIDGQFYRQKQKE